jgi:hypothetical protein
LKLIIFYRDYVTGFHDSPNISEFDEAGIEYDLVEEIPDMIRNWPPGYVVKRISSGNYELEKLPDPPKDRIAQLENESAMLALELVDTQIRLDQAETEQAALLLELVDKGVL